MKHVLCIMACLMIPSFALTAPADSTATASAARNSLRSGMWALQFDVNGSLLSVGSFAGGLSLKRQISPKSACRFGLGFTGNGSTFDPHFPGNPSLENTADHETVSLETAYQRYVNPVARVNAYWTVGPAVRYWRDNAKTTSDSTHVENTHTSWSIGGLASLGAEWFFTRELSLHAEYGLSAWYTKETQHSTFARTGVAPVNRKEESDGWSGGITNGVRLGLSVYF